MSTSTTLLTFASLQNDTSATSDLNTNFAAINTSLASCLSLSGQAPNQMQANLDMNSNRVINLPAPLSINEPMRLADATTLNGGGTVAVSPLPTGGTTGQVLTKNSSTNFDVSWATPSVNVTAGKTLSVTNTLTLTGVDGTTLTFQGSDTYVGRATTDNFSNKTFNANVNGNVFQMFGNTVNSLTGAGAMVLGTAPTINNANLTGTITGAPSFSGNNFLTFANLPQINAYSLLGNVSSSTANYAGFTIGSLSNKASPASGDYVLLQDNAASGALKYALVSSIATAGSVSSIAGNTGAFTLGAGITNSTNIILSDVSYHRGYLSGNTLSAPGGAQTLTITAGVCADSTNAVLMKLASTYTKTMASWAVGSTNGGLDTGSVATSTWYHVYIIERTDTGVVDVLISTSASSPTMPTNYTVFRRVGSILTDGSSNILAFVQLADTFLWKAPVINLDNVSAASTTTTALTTPLGIQCVADFVATCYSGGAGAQGYWFSSPDENDVAPFSLGTNHYNADISVTAVSTYTSGRFNIRTDTTSKIRWRAYASGGSNGGITIVTRGWRDFRGQYL